MYYFYFQGLKPTPPPVPSPQGVMGPPHTGTTLVQQQQQQLMQGVRSPPPIRSPQPNPSPRPAPSPRGPQPVPSPRDSLPSPHHDLAAASAELMGGAPGQPPNQNADGSAQDPTPMTPQDQLSKFVEQL